ncbi:L-2,4-diaminobutyric acid acetyltransferase [Streptomyces albidoflavus]
MTTALPTPGPSGRTTQWGVQYRTPRPADAPAVWRLAERTAALDPNGPHHYALWFRDFADTSLVATLDEEVVGFVTGYRRPEAPDTYFVWQYAAVARFALPFLDAELFESAADRERARGARYVETTAGTGSQGLVTVLEQYARGRSAPVRTALLFPAERFPAAHADEVLYRIGPFPAS